MLFTGVLLRPDPRPNPQLFGRTDLSTSRSRAKIDEQADFEVRSAVARQKPRQIDENPIFDEKISPNMFFWRRKTKRPEMFETRFGKVWRRSEPCSMSYEKLFHLLPGAGN